jgi:hypothetical protein
MRVSALLLPLLALLPGAHLRGQANADPTLDVAVTSVLALTELGRVGTYPNGTVGLSMAVSLCNFGNPVQFDRPMSPEHPFFGFVLCRESDGRFEQLNDSAFAKHAYGVANGNFCGGNCVNPGGGQFGTNCSDTYSVGANGNRFYLGPADEIDPWLGLWNPVGSYFDQGDPAVPPPQNTDGLRSLTFAQTLAMDPVKNRLAARDQDLLVPGASFYCGALLITKGEPESNRGNSWASRQVGPEWDAGNQEWLFADLGPVVTGSILQHWSGSSLASATNGTDDGRLFVAVVVSGPDIHGLWHYEYAVQNRDNSRGVAAFRVPRCASARVFNTTFRDVDGNAGNDWTVSLSATEVSFLAPAGNALEWNRIYNFGFDSDAGPLSGMVTLDQALPGPGAGSVLVSSDYPGEVHNVYLGDGCGVPSPPLLRPKGTPPYAAIPNPTFEIELSGLQPGGTAVVLFADGGASVPIGGCTFYIGGTVSIASAALMANGSGDASLALPVPALAALEGADLFCQGIEAAVGGALFNQLNLTNGLQIRFGNALIPCP